MLKSIQDKFLCPSCGHDKLGAVAFSEDNNEIINGILRCTSCNSLFPIIDRLLDLVPSPLLDLAIIDRFEKEFASQLQGIGYRRPKDAGTGASKPQFEDQLKQRGHFDNYAEGVRHLQRYEEYSKMPFWKAVDAITFQRWKAFIEPGEILVDIGCADGRSSFPHLPRNTVVGFDISRKLVRQAIDKALADGYKGRFSFFVSDGSSLPFKASSFRYVQTYGVLHHLPRPGDVIHQIQRVLQSGGIHFGSENNATVFRSLFDWLMQISPLWYEEAGDEPLISRAMLDEWTRGLPTTIHCETRVFLPPHLANVFSAGTSTNIIRAMDALFGTIPWIKENGGLIIFRIHKSDTRL